MPPRIEAANIEEHVRLQTSRILDAATGLFRSRGYRATDMEDIATAMGLARNSLYRYYPNKDHILLACVQRDMGPFMEQLQALESQFPDARERVGAWLDTQIDIATSPAHATLELMGEIRHASPELRREIMGLHAATNAVLENAIAQVLKGRRRDAGLVAALIAGMLAAAATQVIRNGNKSVVKRELRRAAEKMLEG